MSNELTNQFDSIEEVIAALKKWAGSLPSRTESVQISVFTFAEPAEAVTQSTKELSSEDFFWCLSAEQKIELASDQVDAIIDMSGAYYEGSRVAATEEEQELVAGKLAEIKAAIKALRPTLVTFANDIENQAAAVELIDGLLTGVLKSGARDVYSDAKKLLGKNEELATLLAEWEWNRLLNKDTATVEVRRPIQPAAAVEPDLEDDTDE